MNPLRVSFYYVTKDGHPCLLDTRLHADGILIPAKDWNAAHRFDTSPAYSWTEGTTRKQAWTHASDAIARSVAFRSQIRASLLSDYPPLQSAITAGEFRIVAVYRRVPTKTTSPA